MRTAGRQDGALVQPLIDDHAPAWWNAQPDRESAARHCYDRLVQRNMIDPATGYIHPQFGIILARSCPAFIIILRGQPDGGTLPCAMSVLTMPGKSNPTDIESPCLQPRS